MTGPTQTSEPNRSVTFKALRVELNNLSYFQPLSEESEALVEGLLTDLRTSSQSFRALRQRVDEREREIANCGAKLDMLRREHPRLLRENTELHQQLLDDSHGHEARKKQWAAETGVAAAKLFHMQWLRQQADHRLIELRHSADRLHGRLADTSRLGSGANLAPPTPPRPPAIVVQGPTIFAHQVVSTMQDRGTFTAASSCVNEMQERVRELSARLVSRRRIRAAQVERLAAADYYALAARAEATRVGAYKSAGDAGMSDPTPSAPSRERMRVEQSRLESQVAFLESTCSALDGRRERLLRELSSAKVGATALNRNARQLQSEIAGLQTTLDGHDASSGVENAASLQNKFMALAMEGQELQQEHAILAKQNQELHTQVQDAESCLATASAQQEVDFAELRRCLHIEQQRKPCDTLRRLEAELKAASTSHAKHRASCADLSARLMATSAHEASRRQLLNTRMEEASASTRAAQGSELEAQVMGDRLSELEAMVLEARGEAATLRDCLDGAMAKHQAASLDLARVEREVAALDGETQTRRQSRSSLTTEVEQARVAARDAEITTAEIIRDGDRLRSESGSVQRMAVQLNEELVSGQRRHRELSACVGRVTSELMRWRAVRKSEHARKGELEVRLGHIQDELHCATPQHRQLTQIKSQETFRLEEVLSQVKAGNSRIARRENEARAELMARIAALEPDVDCMRRELVRLAELGPGMLHNIQSRANAMDCACSGGSEELRAQGRLEELAARSRRATGEHKEDQDQLAEHSLRSDALRILAQRLVDNIVSQQSALERDRQEESTLEVARRHESEGCSSVEAELVIATRRLHELQAEGQNTERGAEELAMWQQRLVALLRSGERTREQLAAQFGDLRGAVEREQQRLCEVASGPTSAQTRVEELRAQIACLQRAIAAVDGDHADLIDISAARRRELEELRVRATRLQSDHANTQWSVDRFRREADMQQGELAWGAKEAAVAAQQTAALEAEVRCLSSEAQQRHRETKLGLDDLLHMTRENQLLHDELLQMQRHDKALRARTEQEKAEAFPRLQLLRGRELERENVIAAYQKTTATRQRNEVALEEMTRDKDTTVLEAESLLSELARVREGEEGARARILRENLDLVALRAERGSATRSLEAQELARDEAAAQRARRRHSMGLRQAAISEVFVSDSAAGAEAGNLRIEIRALQQEMHEAKLLAVRAAHEREAIDRQEAYLQDLIAQQRREQLEADAEKASLHRLAGERAARLANAAGGNASKEAAALHCRLEQQDELLAEMEAERQGLLGQVRQLLDECVAEGIEQRGINCVATIGATAGTMGGHPAWDPGGGVS